MNIKQLAYLICAIALLCGCVFGQGMTGSLQGLVTDPGGAAVPNAKVEIKNLTTGATRTTNSGPEGIFVFNSIEPARWDLTITASQGFKAYTQKNIDVTTNEKRDLGTIGLVLGSLTEEISVTATATPVQTASSENSKLIEGTQIANITMKGRDLFGMLQTIPGISFGNALLSGTGNDATSNASGTFGSMQVNGGGTARSNFTVDGVIDLDNGNNSQVDFEPTIDTIAEVRVLTSNYQAEFGHSASGMISVITKGGSQSFHGSAYANKRHEMFNANTFFNNYSSVQKSKYRFFVYGYTIGGPAYIPHLFNTQKKRLFFFWSQEYTKQKPASNSAALQMVPTADQMAGHFWDRCANGTGVSSPCTPAYTDNSGTNRNGNSYLVDPTNNRVNLPNGDLNLLLGTNVYDPTSAAIGRAMLKYMPSPNLCTAAAGIYNNMAISPANCPAGYSTQAITNSSWNYNYNYIWGWTEEHPRRNDTARVDWNITSRLTSFARWSRDYDKDWGPSGTWGMPVRNASNNFVPYSVDFNKPGHGIAIGLTYTITPTMVNEFTFGKIWNGIGWYNHDDSLTLRSNIMSQAGSASSLPFPSFHDLAKDPNVTDPGNFGPRVLESGSGFLNFATYVPSFSFGDAAGRTESAPSTSPCWGQCPYTNWAESWTFSDSVSKVQGKHNLKAGVYVERTAKDQAGNSGSYLGSWNFGNNSSSPYDVGDGYGNAWLGNYSSYAEGNRNFSEWWFWQTEFFAQDSWRVSRRLTLDLGARFYAMPPITNTSTGRNASAEFVAAAYSMNNAERLYMQACENLTTQTLYSTANGQCPNNATASARAYDPKTGTFAGNWLVNTFVPNSVANYPATASPTPGMLVAGTDPRLPQGLYTVPKVSPAFRFGFAWDVFGDGKTAIRGGVGQFLNRLSYNQIAAPSAYPPSLGLPQNVYFGHILDVTLPATQANAAVSAFSPNTDFTGNQNNESTYNGSFMIQQNVGFSTIVEASWVFNLSRHRPYAVSLNYYPLFSQYDNAAAWVNPYTAYLQNNAYLQNLGLTYTGNPALGLNGSQYVYQTPLYYPGTANVCPTCVPGYGNITKEAFEETANYHALQVNVRRNMTKRLSYGFSYTWNKSMGPGFGALLNNNDPGTARSTVFPDKYRNWGPSYSPTPMYFTANWVYEPPNLGKKLNFKPLGWITDNWTVSGLMQWRSDAMTGVPIISFANTNGACTSSSNCYPQWNWTGSTEGARLNVTGDWRLSSIGQSVQIDPAYSTTNNITPQPGNPAVPNAYPMLGNGDNRLINTQAFTIPYPCSKVAQADPHNGIGENMSCFGNAGPGSIINVPGTRVANFDMTFAKSFPLKSEGRSLQFRAEMYNIFNHTQFSGFNIGPQYDWRNWENGVLVQTNSSLNRMNGALNPRQMSMSLRLQF